MNTKLPARKLLALTAISRIRSGAMIVCSLLAALVLISALWAAWALWGVGFFYDRICSQGTDCEVMGQIGDLFGGVNALFAGLALAGLVISLEATRRANAREREWERDKEYVNQIRATYEWAFLALAGGQRDASVAKMDRLEWLSAARHLLRAEKLEAQVQSDAMTSILKEHKEYWRVEIHRLIDRSDLSLDKLAFHSVEEGYRPQIEYRSALVIEQFLGSEWNDPIDEVDAHLLIERPDWEQSKLSRAIERYMVQTLPTFLPKHLSLYPNGRVARSREAAEKAAAKWQETLKAREQQAQQ